MLDFYESDEESDYRDDLSPDILEEFELDNILCKILKFKNHIIYEPEFFSINFISCYEIYNIISNKNSINKKYLTEYQLTLFDDLYQSIYGESCDNKVYNYFYSRIMEKTTL